MDSESKMIYLDYNATSPMRPEVKAEMLRYLDEPLNASSIHGQGRRARKLLEDARKQILRSVNGKKLVFCGGATEANNLALGQIELIGDRQQAIVVSEIEHDSVYNFPAQATVKVDEGGIIDSSHFEQTLSNYSKLAAPSCLVSVMLANNETGVIQPVKELAAITHKYNGIFHCDAVQAYGKININFQDLAVDMMTISSHKIGGPLGAAALIYRENFNLKSLTKGGGQEKNLRAGTENIAAIAGFAKMAQLEVERVSRETDVGLELAIEIEQEIKRFGGKIIGEKSYRLGNTSCIIMPNVPAATQLMHFDLNNIMVSTGSACSSGKVEVSRVLKNMNIIDADKAIRISTGWKTTKDELEKFLKVWYELYRKFNS